MKSVPLPVGTNQGGSLKHQRLALQGQLAAQRELIALHLTPALAPVGKVPSAFPRSLIMRLITLNPSIASKITGGAARLLLGARNVDLLLQGLYIVKFARHLWRLRR